MKIQAKFISLLIILVISCEIVVYSTAKRVAEDLVADLLVRYGQIVSKYDTVKTLAPLIQELNKAKALSSETSILRWAENPDDFKLYQEAFNTLEQYRWKFDNNSYFVALAKNKGYYHNNQDNEFGDEPLRFFLEPEEEINQWFYDFISQPDKVHININPNEQLGVIKLWIDVQINQRGEVLGAIGTGVDFSTIMADLYDTALNGVDTIFIDSEQVIQLYRESGKTRNDLKENSFFQKKVIGYFIESESDIEYLNSMMMAEQAGESPKPIIIHYNGVRHLVTVSYISELEWYELTLIDMQQILPLSKFLPLYIVMGLSVLVLAIFIALAIQRWIIRPIDELELQTRAISENNPSRQDVGFTKKPNDEMGLLMTHFEAMSKRIQNSTHELEEKVAQRTQALDRLASVDPLTELFNRRGMERQLKEELNRAQRENYEFGLLWLDVDYFKKINDSLGHERGDEALKLIANAISDITRDYDSACRWGGDEFLVLIRTSDEKTLELLAERLRIRVRKLEVSSVDKTVSHLLSISIGGTIVAPGSSIKTALINADRALYKAKSSGRNKTIMWDETLACEEFSGRTNR